MPSESLHTTSLVRRALLHTSMSLGVIVRCDIDYSFLLY